MRTAMPRRPGRLVLAAGACLALAAPLFATQNDDLPISRITLYRSGVASFVRQGEIEGDAEVQLRFRTGQVNDILKSMIVLDLGGGRVESATYASKEPLSRRLESFAVDISDSPGRADLLERLRGARIEVRTTEGTHAGAILGVEHHDRIAPEGIAESYAVLSLVTDSGIWSARVDDILSFRLLDQTLAAELDKAIAALAEHRTDNLKTLSLVFRGGGERDVVVGYVHEAPVWKASYRLVLPDDDDDRLTLQGWAIVENTTEEDWHDVRLSLVSGQPVSFVMDLYEPLFVERPEVPVPTGAGARPRTYTGGGQSPFQQSQAPGRARRGMAREEIAQGSPAPMAAKADVALGEAFEQVMAGSVVAAASGQDVGEVFQYTLDAPVSIERQQSAMLPVVSGDIAGRRVSIFNSADGITHPMRGVEIENDTGLQLMPGPVAVYDGNVYAGDAQVGHVSRGDERLLAYAVDLDVDARVESEAESTISRISIVRGMLHQRVVDRRMTRYFFESNDARRERTLVVEHPRLEGWDLVDTPRPEELTDALYRFELALDASGSERLTVSQQRTRAERLDILGFDAGTLATYARGGKVSQDVMDAFAEARSLQSRVVEAERALRELEQERSAIAADQGRIRENIGAIDRTSELYARYVQKLTEQESRLEAIREEVRQGQEQLESRRAALEQYLAGLDVE